MSFFKITLLTLLLVSLTKIGLADSHDQQKNILDQAKEINEEINKKQSSTQANISSEIGENDEEPLPLNDPFAGDDGTASKIVSDVTVEKELVNLSKYKLVGVFNGAIKSFATFVDEGGEFITLEIEE